MLPENFNKNFLMNTDETGRQIVVSSRTGVRYYIEPLYSKGVKWGSIDPATKQLVNKKGAGKYTGAIEEEDSLITPENGFIDIEILEKGTSPYHAIAVRDAKYPTKVAE